MMSAVRAASTMSEVRIVPVGCCGFHVWLRMESLVQLMMRIAVREMSLGFKRPIATSYLQNPWELQWAAGDYGIDRRVPKSVRVMAISRVRFWDWYFTPLFTLVHVKADSII
jgi:hypothetical protein